MSAKFGGNSSVFPFNEADRKQRMWLSQMQCQHCLKSKANGAELRVCSGCKLTKYCTKECQIAAWKAHKEACKATQQTMQRISEDGLSDQIALLRNWTSKHRPVLGQAALVALDLAIEPSRAKKYFLLVQLTRRAMYDRTERAYDVDDVSVMPLVSRDEDPNEGFLPPHVVDTLRQTLEDSPNTCLCPGRKKHKTGKYFVILSSGLGTVPNVVPFAYCEAVLKATTPGSYWKEGLIAKLSEGVVS